MAAIIASLFSNQKNLPMKKTHLIILTIVMAAIPTVAQERQRYFDNFDSSAGVKIYRPYIPIAVETKTQAPNSKNRNKSFIKKTAMTRMSVTDGLAAREMPRAEYNKLLMGSSSQLRGFTTGDLLVDSFIVASSRKYAIDPLLIYSQMHQESSFKPRARSYKGASGLMQLMPATAIRLGVKNIYDPQQNIDGGVRYMRMLLDMFGGDVNLALAGYNAGEGAVMKYGNQIPPYNETREYVRRISARYTEISNPTIARSVRPVSNSTAVRLEQKSARPLNVYEPKPMTIRLDDGRLRLVNQ